MHPHTLGVIGLGAIGGSVAWTASRNGVPRVVGYSTTPADGAAALRAGAIGEVLPNARRLVQQCDFIVLAAPPAATLGLLEDYAEDLRNREVWCTDVGSVKVPIVQLAEERRLMARFAGSHPMAGTHESGFGAARPDLFREAVVYVTPLAGGEAAAREVADFWVRVCGATPVMIDAARHDEALAWTSHLPQAVSSALAVACARFGPAGMSWGTGAQDATRLAAGNVEMWRDILLMNRGAVLAALERFEDTVGDLRQGLQAGDPAAVSAWLAQGVRWRRDLGS